MEPIGVQAGLVRQAAEDLNDTFQNLSIVETRFLQRRGYGCDLGEYAGAAEQYTRFCDAWQAENRLVQSAATETISAMRKAANEYDKVDESASLRVSEAARPAGS